MVSKNLIHITVVFCELIHGFQKSVSCSFLSLNKYGIIIAIKNLLSRLQLQHNIRTFAHSPLDSKMIGVNGGNVHRTWEQEVYLSF